MKLYRRTGQAELLDGAVQASREAVATTPASDPALPSRLSNRGIILRVLYERTGDTRHLTEAVSALRAAVSGDSSARVR